MFGYYYAVVSKQSVMKMSQYFTPTSHSVGGSDIKGKEFPLAPWHFCKHQAMLTCGRVAAVNLCTRWM